jgi:vesicle-fusing ATPase
LIDEAILRPGRLELHVEIGLPDGPGRLQIIHIHTEKMRNNNRISAEAIEKLPELAEMTKNFTGAEIEGLVRNAASFAFARNINMNELKSADSSKIRVEWRDFVQATSEIVPAFGNKDQTELNTLFRNGLTSYGDAFEASWSTLQKLVNQSRTSTKTPLLTVLLEGLTGCGKTAIAAKLACDSDFPLIRMLSADSMIGYSEGSKCQAIQRAFMDAYKSELSIIFIDDIERILEYTPSGPRFSNIVLQTLMVYLKKVPPHPDRRLMIVATTAIADLLEDLQLTQVLSTLYSNRSHRINYLFLLYCRTSMCRSASVSCSTRLKSAPFSLQTAIYPLRRSATLLLRSLDLLESRSYCWCWRWLSHRETLFRQILLWNI